MSDIDRTDQQYSGYPPWTLGPDFGNKIEAMEKAGQEQLLHSDRLPTEGTIMAGDQAAFEALGFTFGPPDERDPMFRPATLPEGWQREGSDHSMWSYITDQHGRRRVSIFYKAAYYDRNARATLNGLDGYVRNHVEYDGPLTITDEWATTETVTAAAERLREQSLKQAEEWRGYPTNDTTTKYVKQYTEAAGKYSKLLERLAANPSLPFETVPDEGDANA